ncbi:MAG: hypothetical protein QXG39_07635 [Candidatus Aenigmatarchaeota archaeon]
MKQKIGEYSFLVGIVIAVLAGLLLQSGGLVAIALVILGLIVGLLNITAKETTPFLIASVALLLAGSAGLEKLPIVGRYLEAIVGNIVVFVAPAAAIVALKTVFDLAKKK